MTAITVLDADESDFSAVVAMNVAEVHHTSPMDEARLRLLDSAACYHKVAVVDGKVAAFLLAMRDGCAYVNDNFEWFASRYPTFLYVDRIVVAAAHQGLGLGTLLYNNLFDYARANKIPVIACEYNIVPPNEPSRLFHDKFGFREVGTQWLDNGSKQVSLQTAESRPST